MLRTAIETHPLTEGSMCDAGPRRFGRVGFADQLRKSIVEAGQSEHLGEILASTKPLQTFFGRKLGMRRCVGDDAGGSIRLVR